MHTSALLILSYFTITQKITGNFGELLLLNKLSQKPQIDRILKSYNQSKKKNNLIVVAEFI